MCDSASLIHPVSGGSAAVSVYWHFKQLASFYFVEKMTPLNSGPFLVEQFRLTLHKHLLFFFFFFLHRSACSFKRVKHESRCSLNAPILFVIIKIRKCWFTNSVHRAHKCTWTAEPPPSPRNFSTSCIDSARGLFLISSRNTVAPKCQPYRNRQVLPQKGLLTFPNPSEGLGHDPGFMRHVPFAHCTW